MEIRDLMNINELSLQKSYYKMSYFTNGCDLRVQVSGSDLKWVQYAHIPNSESFCLTSACTNTLDVQSQTRSNIMRFSIHNVPV